MAVPFFPFLNALSFVAARSNKYSVSFVSNRGLFNNILMGAIALSSGISFLQRFNGGYAGSLRASSAFCGHRGPFCQRLLQDPPSHQPNFHHLNYYSHEMGPYAEQPQQPQEQQQQQLSPWRTTRR